MGRDFTDDIDECCEAILGHTNWGFADSNSMQKLKLLCQKGTVTVLKVIE